MPGLCPLMRLPLTPRPALSLQNNNYDCPLPEEETNPKGSGWLYHSDAIRTYLNLMGKSKKDATLEACAGALQNLTASKGLVSGAVPSLPQWPHPPATVQAPLPPFPPSLSPGFGASREQSAWHMLGSGLSTGETPLPFRSCWGVQSGWAH